jgi:hypothetical protein
MFTSPFSSRSVQGIVLLFILCFLSPNARGQVNVQAGAGISDIGFLLEGELNYFGYELSSLQHSLPAFSYSFGIGKIFLPGKRLQPMLELQYSREGINYSRSYLFDDIGYHVRIDYLKIPLLLHLNLNMKRNRNRGIQLGPFVSYRMRAIRDLTLQGVTDRRTVENVNPLDAGLMAGAHLEILQAPISLDAGFRMSYSLVNMMTPLGGTLMRYYGPDKEYVRNITMMFTLSTPIRGSR